MGKLYKRRRSARTHSYRIFGRKYITPIFNPLLTNIFAALSLVLSLAFGYHVLMHLPSIDFRAYKIGDNLIENMSTPPDAPKAIQEFTWTFDVNGTQKTIITDGSYPNVKVLMLAWRLKLLMKVFNLQFWTFLLNQNLKI